MPADKVAQFLGVPVAARFSDDTFWVNVAVSGATTLVGAGKAMNSKLAKEFQAFARALIQTSRGTAGTDLSPQTGREMLAVA